MEFLNEFCLFLDFTCGFTKRVIYCIPLIVNVRKNFFLSFYSVFYIIKIIIDFINAINLIIKFFNLALKNFFLIISLANAK